MRNADIELEEALDDLDRIVAELEEGNMGLEESLVLFEKGMTLVNICNIRLGQAEQRIESLTGELPSDLSCDRNGRPQKK